MWYQSYTQQNTKTGPIRQPRRKHRTRATDSRVKVSNMPMANRAVNNASRDRIKFKTYVLDLKSNKITFKSTVMQQLSWARECSPASTKYRAYRLQRVVKTSCTCWLKTVKNTINNRKIQNFRRFWSRKQTLLSLSKWGPLLPAKFHLDRRNALPLRRAINRKIGPWIKQYRASCR